MLTIALHQPAPAQPSADVVEQWSQQVLAQADLRAERAAIATDLLVSAARSEGPREKLRTMLDPTRWPASYAFSMYRMSDAAGLIPKAAVESLGARIPDRPALSGDNIGNHALEPLTAAIRQILRQHGVPEQLIAVALIESGFNSRARSPKGALGLWQLMPETARRFGLVVTDLRDDRFNPIRSTFAAARYLRELYSMWGDWGLALAAYNAGEGRVQQALETGGLRTFADLARRGLLPSETVNYVPSVLAAAARFEQTSPAHGLSWRTAFIVPAGIVVCSGEEKCLD